jgi:hypothetical protein
MIALAMVSALTDNACARQDGPTTIVLILSVPTTALTTDFALVVAASVAKASPAQIVDNLSVPAIVHRTEHASMAVVCALLVTNLV